jgi:signal recognition particle subunit SEC65
VPHPRIEEIQDAAQKLGMKNESSIDAGYSKTPWQKTGMIRVEKKTPKEQILKVIAKQIIKARSAAAPAPTKK